MPRLQIMVCDLDGTLLDQFFVGFLPTVATDVAASNQLRDVIEMHFEVGETLDELDAPKA